MLTSKAVEYFATTTGTTGKSKLIPITSELSTSLKLKVGSLMYYLTHRGSGLNLQRNFTLAFSSRTRPLPGGKRCGPVSQYMQKSPPFLLGNRDVFKLSDEQVAFHVHAVYALQDPHVGCIEALMSTVVCGFWVYVENNWKTICHDISEGSLSLDFLNDKLDRTRPDHAATNMNLLLSISTQLKPNAARANELRQEFQAGFVNICRRVWPNVTFVRMLNTGGFAHAAKKLRDVYMTDVAQYSLLHVASEGFMGVDVSSHPSKGTYTAAVDLSFFEYIHEEDTAQEQPETLFADQLQAGESYEVVISTNRGLYRYRTGDVIRVTDFLNECPVYSFQYR